MTGKEWQEAWNKVEPGTTEEQALNMLDDAMSALRSLGTQPFERVSITFDKLLEEWDS